MLQYIVPATGLLFTLENILWINIGVFVGSVFAAIPGLSVILCVILFLPVTYTMTAIPGMMFPFFKLELTNDKVTKVTLEGKAEIFEVIANLQ